MSEHWAETRHISDIINLLPHTIKTCHDKCLKEISQWPTKRMRKSFIMLFDIRQIPARGYNVINIIFLTPAEWQPQQQSDGEWRGDHPPVPGDQQQGDQQGRLLPAAGAGGGAWAGDAPETRLSRACADRGRGQPPGQRGGAGGRCGDQGHRGAEADQGHGQVLQGGVPRRQGGRQDIHRGPVHELGPRRRVREQQRREGGQSRQQGEVRLIYTRGW